MNKRMIALGFAGAILLSSLLQSCTTEETFEETTEASALTEAISESQNMLRIAARGEASLFKIVGSTKTTATDYYANLIKKKLSAKEKGFSIVILMLTDVLLEGTQLIYLGDDDTIRQAFNVSPKDSTAFLPHIMSRKKQIIPMLSALWG